MTKLFLLITSLLGGAYFYLSNELQKPILDEDPEIVEKKTKTIVEMADYLAEEEKAPAPLPEPSLEVASAPETEAVEVPEEQDIQEIVAEVQDVPEGPDPNFRPVWGPGAE